MQAFWIVSKTFTNLYFYVEPKMVFWRVVVLTSDQILLRNVDIPLAAI